MSTAKSLKAAASGRWNDILIAAGIPADCLSGKNGPCPKCAGTDRFAAFKDVNETGGVICRKCHAKNNRDGLATIQWFRNCSFHEAMTFVNQFLGLDTKGKPTARPGGGQKGKGRIVATNDYLDESGKVLFQVVRYDPKDFRQRRPNGKGGWIWGVKGVRAVPYRLPELLAEPTRPVVVVEGEKDCDNLARIDVLATCNAGGAKKWTAGHSEFLRGRRVIVLPDNDEAGQDHALQVAQSLQGVADSVRIVELPGLPEKGDASDWIAAGGTKEELLRLVNNTPLWTPSPEYLSEPSKYDSRLQIEVTPDEHLVIEAASAAIGYDDLVFNRGGVLVQLVDCSGTEQGIHRGGRLPHLRAMDVHNVREVLSRQVYFFRMVSEDGEEEEKQVHPPGWCCSSVSSRGNWPGMRVIKGITSVPVLREDGTVLESEGFDEASGLLYLPNDKFPGIAESPTKAEAQTAATRLIELVSDFPFAGEEHKSAWLSGLLTPLARYAFAGPAPLFLVDANTRGSGKTFLTDIIGEIVSGRSLPRMTCPRDDDESRKRITALAIAGDPMILLDNISGSLGSASLDAALTGTEWEDRRLGKSEMVRMPLMAVWYATGNNVQIREDTSRRIVLIRLESPLERPEERTGFRFPFLMEHLRSNRASLLIDAITCLRAFIVAGRPQSRGAPFGSFEGWARIVRDCICWLELPDPTSTRSDLNSRSDSSADLLRGLINGLLHSDPGMEGLTSAQIVQLVEGDEPVHEELRAAVLVSCDGNGRKISTRHVGNTLGKFRGRVSSGRVIDCRKPGGIAKWFVREFVSATRKTDPPEQLEQHEVTPGFDPECGSGGSGGSDSVPSAIDAGVFDGRVRVTI